MDVEGGNSRAIWNFIPWLSYCILGQFMYHGSKPNEIQTPNDSIPHY